MKNPLPPSVTKFEEKHPEVWRAFANLAEKCHQAGGPLSERDRRLVKLGAAIALRHEGAVHAATRQGLAAGLSADELYHAAILTITTIGWPAAYAAMTWITDVLQGAGSGSPEHLP